MKIYIVGTVGSGKSTLARKLSEKNSMRVFHLDNIVHEGERSKNLGTKLINFAIDRARELSCERVMLNNSMESISYKRNFYKNLGFSQRDTMANFVLKLTD